MINMKKVCRVAEKVEWLPQLSDLCIYVYTCIIIREYIILVCRYVTESGTRCNVVSRKYHKRLQMYVLEHIVKRYVSISNDRVIGG